MLAMMCAVFAACRSMGVHLMESFLEKIALLSGVCVATHSIYSVSLNGYPLSRNSAVHFAGAAGNLKQRLRLKQNRQEHNDCLV
jgi:hypothetical protein